MQTIRHALTCATLFSAASLASAATIHVRADAPPGGSGATWATASNNLRTALNAANAGDEVWIARGTYKPDTILDRGIRFTIKSGVRVYGGFAGNETAIVQRPADNDPTAADPAFDTILSGEIGAPGPDDNTIVLVDFIAPATGTILDRVVITDATNTSGFAGGARISIASPTISNTLFTKNHSGGGGALFIDVVSNPTIDRCVFKSNTSSGGGAALIRQSSNPLFRNCSFISNSSTNNGGGAIQLVFSAKVTVENSSFSSNDGGGTGGGAISASLTSEVTLRDSSFTSNVGSPPPVASGGGAININSSTLLAERCTFTSNSAHQGGAIDFQSGSITIKDCTFSQNSAVSGGAATVWNANNTFENSTFEGNTGSAGGVFYVSAPASFTRCTFRNNTTNGAVNSGGVFYNYGSVTATDCEFEFNRSNVGGVIHTSSGSSTFDRCSMISNTANATGGVAVHQFGGSITYRNCLLARNTASFMSSVAHVAAGAATYASCTIADNTGTAQALYAGSSTTITASNSILRNAGTELDGPGTRDATFSNIDGGFAGAGNINAAPIYVDALSADYRLAAGSPGIDAGNNALLPIDVTTDIASMPRYMDDPATADSGVGPAPIIDIGAHEFQPAIAPPCLGDADGNRIVNFSDITAVLASFGATYTPTGPGDADQSGVVNFTDITTVLANFGITCP